MLLASLAGLALVLACLGVYSVMAHLVAFRTSEIGIRMALGASPAAVMRLVLGHGRKLTLLGIGLGIAGSLAVSRLMQQTLFEVDAADPAIYVGAVGGPAAGGRERVVVPGPAGDANRSRHRAPRGVSLSLPSRRWRADPGRAKDTSLHHQAGSSRSDPPSSQRLDREDNGERSGHSEDIESPDEQQGAALLEELRAQSIAHVEGQHPGGHHAAK